MPHTWTITKQPHEKTILYKMLLIPCNMVDADIFTFKNNTFLCIVDYYTKFHVLKETNSLSAANLIRSVKIVFAVFELPKEIMLDAGTYFISYKCRQYCRQLNIEHAITSFDLHQSSKQVDRCIKFVIHTIKKSHDYNYNIKLTMLQMRSTPLGARLLVVPLFYLTG